ncbi:MAG TPA: branched-chain amino acid ABC transporter permease [Methylomirabilota bacterium]|nr:branched-chain amino acid ABC transporter permease [Methylomirabilota bacterium]
MTQLVLGQVLNGAIIGAMYGIIALGITLTFGITGIVNFALGEFMMIGAYATYTLAERGGLSYPMAVIPACLIAAAAGYLSNKAFFRFTRNNLVNGLLVSIGLISIFESAAMLLWTATPVEMHFVLPGALRVGDIGLPKMKLVVFGVIVVVIVATYLALARTWLGRAAYAYAQNPEAAMLMGVHTPRLESAVMLYSTGLAGLGGALYASLYSLEPAMGGVYVLKGMEAAILGGIGSLMGSLWGGVILGVIEGVGSIFLPTAFRDAYGLAVLVAILLFRPSGLFGDE